MNLNRTAHPIKTSDILLDAEDRALASRGAILDKEGQALLLRLRALKPPAGGGAANATGAAAAAAVYPQQRSSKLIAQGSDPADGEVAATGAGGGADGGWEAVESSLRHAFGLRYVSRGGRGRSRYAEEILDALRGLEQARYVMPTCFEWRGRDVRYSNVAAPAHFSPPEELGPRPPEPSIRPFWLASTGMRRT